ncbi:MAG TPA: hypothetical protein VFY49_18970, partial [Myxococcota bacterium]|nr:hypothetical protein [Myxococcota bacterium]
WSPGTPSHPAVSWISALRGKGTIDVDCVLGTTGSAEQQIHFPDCQSHWCRFEVCADHDASTGEFRVRAQWAQVAGAKHMEARLGAPGQYGPDCSPERNSSATIVGGIAVAEFASVCCPETTGGSIYVSHVMASQGPFDPDFWIGPAVEIEGRRGALPK